MRQDWNAEQRRIALDAAWRIGSERGASGLTLRALASAMNVNTNSIYQAYGDKAGVMRALRGMAAEKVASALDDKTTIAGGMLALCAAYVEFMRRHGWAFEDERMSLNAADLHHLHPDRHVFARAVQRQLGEVRQPSGETESTCLHLWIAMRGLALLSRHDDDASTREIVHGHVARWLRAVGL